MTQLLKSDIFFVVTTIAVVAVATTIIIALIYLIGVLRDARKLSSRAREEGEAIIHDVGEIREAAKKESLWILNSLKKRFTSKKTSKNRNEKTSKTK